jgi:hypothetical protein
MWSGSDTEWGVGSTSQTPGNVPARHPKKFIFVR